MADYLISEETLTNMANSIRTLSGATGEITPGEMVTSINETKSAIDMINEHEANENNPHGVTAAQVGALPITGGTLTGNLSGKYITGTWLQTTQAGAMSIADDYSRICVLDKNGWVYTRTKAEMLSDIGAASATAVQTAQNTANAAQTTADSKAPMYTYGTTDLTAGSSPLATGQLHFVYE